MKDTILYISDREEKVISFLKKLFPKLLESKKEYLLDLRHDLLITDKVDVVGKSFYGSYLGCGYGHCLYYCIDETIDKNRMTDKGNQQLMEILFHVRGRAKEVSEQEILYMLDMKVGG